MPKKPMTVTDAYNKAKPKGKTSARENVTRSGQGSGNRTKTTSGMGSGNRTSRASVGAAREKVTRTGQGSGNKGPKKNSKSFLDRVGDIGKTVGRVGTAVVKDSVNTVTNPFGAAKSTIGQLGKDVKNKNIAGLGLAAASMIPIPGAKGSSAAIKAAGAASKAATAASALSKASKAGKATKTLSQLADDAIKAGTKGAKKVKPVQGITVKKGGGKFKTGGEFTPPPSKPKPAAFTDNLSSSQREQLKKILKENNGSPLTASQIAQFADKAGGDVASYSAKIRAATPKLKRELARDTVKPVLSKPAPKPAGTPAPKQKVDTTPKVGSVPKPKPKPKPAEKTMAKPDVPKVSSAQSELTTARAELEAFKKTHGAKYRTVNGFKQLQNKIAAKQQKVANAAKGNAGGVRPQRGVNPRTMTNAPVKTGDAQRTYSSVGRSNTPRNGMTESPKPNKGQYEGDLLRGQARNDAARMSNRGLRGSSRATREGRTAENKARNVENIKIRENDRKVARYEEMRQKALQSKKPKDVVAAKKYAEFWGLKGIKRLK